MEHMEGDNRVLQTELISKKDSGNRTMMEDKRFDKNLTVCVEIVGDEKITMMELLRGINEVCGAVNGCRFKVDKRYEITMNHRKGKERLIDGFKIKNCQIMARDLSNDELVVSFMNLPVYITDEEILEKLNGWGVKATSPIKRRKWPGTDIADGTRFCKVKFTDTVQSLPYSTKFETLEGAEYFRVIHNRQVKVCRICIQPGHVLRDCPEFTCHKCDKQGHYARECNELSDVRYGDVMGGADLSSEVNEEENTLMQEDAMGNTFDDIESQQLHSGQKDHINQAEVGTPSLQRAESGLAQGFMDNKEKDRHVGKTTTVNENPQSLASAKTALKREGTVNIVVDNDDDDENEYDDYDLYDDVACDSLQLLVRKKRMLNDKGEKGNIKKKK